MIIISWNKDSKPGQESDCYCRFKRDPIACIVSPVLILQFCLLKHDQRMTIRDYHLQFFFSFSEEVQTRHQFWILLGLRLLGEGRFDFVFSFIFLSSFLLEFPVLLCSVPYKGISRKSEEKKVLFDLKSFSGSYKKNTYHTIIPVKMVRTLTRRPYKKLKYGDGSQSSIFIYPSVLDTRETSNEATRTL